MLLARLHKRCKSAELVGLATATGYQLSFCKKSKDGSGKATITKTLIHNDSVPGVLFRINESEIGILDKSEGTDYTRDDDFVVTTALGEKISVSTYIALPACCDEGIAPYDWYRNLVLAGAVSNQLPGEHIERLQAVITKADPIADRAARLEALCVLGKPSC